MSRYETASACAGPRSWAAATTLSAKTNSTVPTASPTNTAAATDWPVTWLASRRWRAPRARGNDRRTAGTDRSGQQSEEPKEIRDRPHGRPGVDGLRFDRQVVGQERVIHPHQHVQGLFDPDRNRQEKQFADQLPVGRQCRQSKGVLTRGRRGSFGRSVEGVLIRRAEKFISSTTEHHRPPRTPDWSINSFAQTASSPSNGGTGGIV